MRQSNPLELVEPGTLSRPGPLGRLLRLGLGGLCLYALWDVLSHANVLVSRPYSSLGGLVVIIAVAVCTFNYVVNIGFSKSWGQRPLIVSLGIIALSAAVAFVATGGLDSPIVGVPLMFSLAYLYGHLGFAFVLAALLATPGCEMRSIPEALGRVRGRRTDEHACPATFITKLDEWERRRRESS